MSITESYDIAFEICRKVRKGVDLPENVVVYSSAWYDKYFVISIRNASSDVVERVRDYLDSVMADYPGWLNTRNSSDSNEYHIHFDYE